MTGKVTKTRKGEILSGADLEFVTDMLKLIAWHGCVRFHSGSSCETAGKVLGAYYGDEAWCHPCIANLALRELNGGNKEQGAVTTAAAK